MSSKVVIAVFLGLVTSFCATASIDATLSKWNLVTSGDLKHVGDIEGRAYVGGNVTMTGSFQVGNGNSGVAPTDITLAVGGNIVSGNPINLNGGSITIGGTDYSRTVNPNSHGTVSIGSSWAASHSPIPQMAQDSTYWSTLGANGTASIDASDHYIFTAPKNAALAVFNITDTASFENSLVNGFELAVGSSTTTILINVNSLDGIVNWSKGNFFDLFQQSYWKGRVLFNFYNATSITLHDQFTGYLFAPNASVTANGNIDGGIFAKDLYEASEVHLPDRNTTENSWYGDLPDAPVSSVPEPAAYGLWSGLGLLALCIRSALKCS
jgi:choice-of-anchor A domain-containing protein